MCNGTQTIASTGSIPQNPPSSLTAYMPRKRRPQPATPPGLPEPPSDSDKKQYYVAGDKVYFVRAGGTYPATPHFALVKD